MGEFSLSPRRLTLACVAIEALRRGSPSTPAEIAARARTQGSGWRVRQDSSRDGQAGLSWCLCGSGQRFLAGGQTYIVIR